MLCRVFSDAAAEGRNVFVLDEHRRCLVSGCKERLKPGECIDDFILTSGRCSGGSYEGSLCRMGHMYCVRYTEAQGIYVGEILSSNEVSFLAEHTDGIGGHVSVFSSMEYDLSLIWEKKHALEQLIDAAPEIRDVMYQMERPLYRVSASSKNAYEYLSMVCAAPRRTVVDVVRLCKELTERCNSALSSSGRRVECRLPQGEKLFIRSDVRHIVSAVLNAVQNALLYSPRDSVPVLEVCRIGRRVRITIENVNQRDTGEDIRRIFRSGYGIPILRRFAALVGGELDLELEGAVAFVRMDIPAATEEDIAEYALEEAVTHSFSDGAPDYVQLQMMLVADMYIDSETTGNVQYTVT